MGNRKYTDTRTKSEPRIVTICPGLTEDGLTVILGSLGYQASNNGTVANAEKMTMLIVTMDNFLFESISFR
ncbi:MAG: hypothetical protein L6N96_01905 [Candidatus Methylarchaceae archaeon HK02M2]|nr:hypothetical protein [Candidatus Methylarchaceae archaeon HK02M2]